MPSRCSWPLAARVLSRGVLLLAMNLEPGARNALAQPGPAAEMPRMGGAQVDQMLAAQAEQIKFALMTLKNDPETPKSLVAGLQEQLSTNYEKLGRLPEAKAAIEEAIQTEIAAHQNQQHWHLVSARARKKHVDLLMKLVERPDKRDLLTTIKTLRGNANDESGKSNPAGFATGVEQIGAIYKRELGDDDAVYIESLEASAATRLAIGQAAEARRLCREMLDALKRAVGEHHPEYASGLFYLSQTYDPLTQYNVVRDILLVARSVYQEQGVKETNPEHFQVLTNLAQIAMSLGDERQALECLSSAAAVAAWLREEQPLDIAMSSSAALELAYDYAVLRRPDLALPFLKQSHDILEKLSPLERVSPEYAAQAMQCALAYMGIRSSDPAEQARMLATARTLLRRASNICFSLATADPATDYLPNITILGLLNTFVGDKANARKAVDLGLELCKKFPAERADYEWQLQSTKAMCLQLDDQFADAEQAASQGVQLLRNDLAVKQFVQTEGQQLALLEFSRGTLDYYLSLTQRSGTPAQNVYPLVLPWKGSVFAHQRWLRLMQQSSALTSLYQKWSGLIGKLPSPVSGPAPPSPASTEQIENFQRELNALASSIAPSNPSRTIGTTVEEVQKALPPGVLLVDFLEYDKGLLPKESIMNAAPVPWLTAFLVRNDEVTRVEIGPAAPVRQAVDQWRQAIGADLAASRARAGRDPGQAVTPVDPAAWQKPAQWLHENVWKQLGPFVRENDVLLISADGALARFPFAALPGASPGRYLIEDHAIAMMPVPQLLPALLADEGKSLAADSLLLVGHVNYGQVKRKAGNRIAPIKDIARLDPDRAGLRAPAPLADGSIVWEDLKETDGEILKIGAEFERSHERAPVPLRLDGKKATEEALKHQASRFRYIHLATHGFFARVDAGEAGQPDSGFTLYSPYLVSKKVGGWHPGLLSGIVMAGANEPQDPGQDNEILTALEFATIDLRATDLLVLSACETGLGPTAGGEGLLGLQRACQVAGARTVIASLWRVQDRNARSLMEDFYVNLWQGKMSKLEAMRQAQISAIKGGLERGPDGAAHARKPSEPYRAPPSVWAAWIVSGDWR